MGLEVWVFGLGGASRCFFPCFRLSLRRKWTFAFLLHWTVRRRERLSCDPFSENRNEAVASRVRNSTCLAAL